jgi:hypothetical protein
LQEAEEFVQTVGMSENSYTETSSTGWLGRIGGAIKGVLFGLLLIVVSLPVLFLNEGRAVATRKSLEEGAKSYVTVSSESVNPKNDGKLVYLTGDTVVEGMLSDPDFMVSAAAVSLKRKVEVFQWKENEQTETKKKLGGGEETVTTYTYEKIWTDRPIDSSAFRKKQGYENPKLALEGKMWSAERVTVGAFALSPGLLGQVNNFVKVSEDSTAEFPEEVAGKKVHRESGGFYLGESPAAPTIGDLRVSHEVAMPGTVSIIAKQKAGSFEPYIAKAGGTIEMLETGKQSAESMFASAQAANKMLTWVLRVVGFIMMLIGFNMLFRPLSVLADVVPFIGNIVGAGTGFIAFLLSLPLSLLVISVAWIFYRPLIGIPLVVAAIVGFVLLFRALMAQKKKRMMIA